MPAKCGHDRSSPSNGFCHTRVSEGREGGEGGREGWREGGREGGRERREGGREGGETRKGELLGITLA